MFFIQAANTAIKVNEIVQSQNIKLCKINHKNDPNNIDKKYINLDSSNLLDVLAALIKMCNKSKLNSKIKNVKIVQKHVKKEKQYIMLRILC